MTITDPQPSRLEVPFVAVDLYRDIHKGIRSELFEVTERAGNLDPADAEGRRELATHVRSVVRLLVEHAEHEDAHVQPALEVHLPALAEKIASDHHAIDARLGTLEELADAATGRVDLHRLYLEVASFTSAYLEHQDVEERVVMPALEAAIGVEATGAIHGAIVGSIPPDEMARSLAVMLPAMNIDDRAELLGGMRANAPAEVFGGVWSLAGSVLAEGDHRALAARLGLS